jgi:hypothetical protein
MRKLSVLSVVTVGLWTLSLTANTSRAAVDAETNEIVNNIADLLAKGDTAAAKKVAAELAKNHDYETVMHGFKPRSKKGIGVGTKPGAVTPDGIELKINALARDGITAGAMNKEREAITRAAYVTQAIAEFAAAKPWEKPQGKKTKAAWIEWSDKMVEQAAAFTAAAKTGSPADLKKAASNIKYSCDGCHLIFK